jgi:hypothetical protein
MNKENCNVNGTFVDLALEAQKAQTFDKPPCVDVVVIVCLSVLLYRESLTTRAW